MTKWLHGWFRSALAHMHGATLAHTHKHIGQNQTGQSTAAPFPSFTSQIVTAGEATVVFGELLWRHSDKPFGHTRSLLCHDPSTASLMFGTLFHIHPLRITMYFKTATYNCKCITINWTKVLINQHRLYSAMYIYSGLICICNIYRV